MKPEDKELLLKDLCARLPYSPICHIVGENGADIDDILTTSTIQNLDVWVVKPYLRHLSSMTEEEQKEFVKFHCVNICPIVITEELTISNEAKMFEWLNKKMFDYRGLIPKGLAIDVTEDNNPYKNDYIMKIEIEYNGSLAACRVNGKPFNECDVNEQVFAMNAFKTIIKDWERQNKQLLP